MAEVTLSIGGYSYKVSCRDGEEPHLLKLGEAVDAKAQEAKSAVGNTSEVRQLLLAALLFADEALERTPAPVAAPAPVDPAPLEAIAARLEAFAERLENPALNP
jgi:cell division protein ZapA